ncbi:Pumilio-like 24 [Vitis vinifera]|uniref:Pumilio-like 24 n=1 Tax=Vitis vinifera TaxID=29760 RepID=A0A438IR00_VITVI|nr:Pumilio-like 24 [Vitis vinifera]
MRRRNIAKEDRSRENPEIAGSHVSSRVLQTCVKYCTQAERDAVFEELQPQLLTLACNTYAVHLVKKSSKKHLAAFMSSSMAMLLLFFVIWLDLLASLDFDSCHTFGAIVEHAYQLGNATQKQELLMELYATELQLFKDLASVKESRLIDVISKLGLQKGSVLRHMSSVIQPILEKGIVDHSIIHRALMEYLSIADKSSAAEVIQQLSGALLVRMIHTRDGSRIGLLCIKHGSAKERKKIIKGMKGHIDKIAHDQCGSMVLAYILSTVDDTKLLTKVIIRELQAILKELLLDKNGRRVLLQLLHPNCSRYFSPEDLSESKVNPDSVKEAKSSKTKESGDEETKGDLEVTTAEANENTSPSESHHIAEGGKKDPNLRRQELLVDSGLAENLIDTCIESAGELLRSNFGKEVMYEVATGGAGGILRPALDEKLDALHGAIASLAAQPKSEESEEEHVLENFHSSRTIRKLVLDCPTFASTLWKIASWREVRNVGPGSQVVLAFLEASDSEVCELAKGELQPLIDSGILKIPETKQ